VDKREEEKNMNKGDVNKKNCRWMYVNEK